MQFLRVVCILSLALRVFAADPLLERPDVRKALDYIRANDEKTFASQVTIAEIAAPTFHEEKRAQYMATEFRRVGLTGVEVDEAGNVLGWREGQTKDTFVLAAHLDISFATGVNTKVRREGNRWFGPGLADDSRGLAALLTIAEAMNAGGVRTRQTVLFVANVGEEGLGDLNGMRYLFEKSAAKDRLREFISIDGAEPSHIVSGGAGVKRYRVGLTGPGGHSYGNFGRPSAIHAAGRIVAQLADMDVPEEPKTTYNIGRIEGGSAVNAIAEDCSFEVDLRSVDPGLLDRIEAKLFEAVRTGVERENQARAASGVTVKSEMKLVGNRPAGETKADNPLVMAAKRAIADFGSEPQLEFSSTDANLPISLGIPAITMGGGGNGGNAHSLQEWYEPVDAWKGPQTVLLTILGFDTGLLF